VADGVNLPEIVRRTMEANTRLYRGWLELSLDYFRGIAEILDPDGVASEPAETMEPELGALVLEAEGGKAAKGAFLVTNDLGRDLTCTLTSTAFVGVDDKTVKPKVLFEPATVKLAPGEQRVVNATITMGKSWDPGAAFTGEFGIKGMKGFSVPVVLRRLSEVDDAPVQGSPIDQISEDATQSRRKAAPKKRTPAKKKTPK